MEIDQETPLQNQKRELLFKQNFSEMDYQSASSDYIAKFEENSNKRRLYIKPQKEYSIGSHPLCTVQLSSDCGLYICLIEVTKKGTVYIIPKSEVPIYINDNQIQSRTLLSNFDIIRFYTIELKYVTFYENIDCVKNESLGYKIKEIVPYLYHRYLKDFPIESSHERFIRIFYQNYHSIEQFFHILLSFLKETETMDDSNEFGGIIRQIVSHYWSIILCDIGTNIVNYDTQTYQITGQIRRTTTRINFDELEDEEDPFEKFKRETLQKQSNENQ